ncbi:hypothetical protein [Methanobacterium aggregans]|uniref:hypothetical protein n=2 Tax=Methanobacterium aggregans TaxID=1615586 RepID=UPI001AE1CCF7
MIHITKKENMVLNKVKYFQSEYEEGVPYNILKLDLELSEMELKDILKILEDKKVISRPNNHIKMCAVDEINVLESKAEVKREELDEMEEKAFKIITELAGKNGYVSRHSLEGHMLYGELKLNTLKTYNLIISLENKGLIKRVQLSDGEYYSLN